MPCPVERPWATGFISSVMAHALWDAQSVQIVVGMQWSTHVCLFVSCPLLPLSITVNTFLYSHLDPLNYPLTNANKKTNTVEDSSSWWKCNRKILSLSILRVWPVQYMMTCHDRSMIDVLWYLFACWPPNYMYCRWCWICKHIRIPSCHWPHKMILTHKMILISGAYR